MVRIINKNSDDNKFKYFTQKNKFSAYKKDWFYSKID